MVANNAFFERPVARTLLQDIEVFHDYLNPTAFERQTFFWFGPAGTVTPLHHDPCNILICQVTGRKHFKLIPSNQWAHVYNDTGFFSPVDCENPDFERWPQFR